MHLTDDFLGFIALSPSSYHAAAAVERRLTQEGFLRQDDTEEWDARPGGHVMVRGGAVVAWWVPEDASPESGFRIIGSHTDSPGFKLKPRGDLGSHGWQQAGVEVYGGPILASWLDRELALAGRIVLADGSVKLVNTGPVLRIPHVAIHLDRSVNSGLTLNPQRHMQPVFAVGEPDVSIIDVIADIADVEPSDIVSHDLITVPTQHGEVFGAHGDFIASARLDNLSSVHPSMTALIEASKSDDASSDILVLAAFDHEEVGSSSTTGAGGPLLEEVLTRTALALGADEDERRRMFNRSTLVSADAAHSIHPNFSDKHDPVNYPIMGSGPVLKVNANQRYASNALTAGMWARACQIAGVPHQVFAGNNDVPCGSTIGPISATRLGIETVDVGIPLLSMHSAREMAGVKDLLWFEQALEAYLVN
ncbi:putative M18 family aminopeptidase 2 [Corynebacterium deserti GIMN1.010]|uniref:M18 family aminopeptidase n=1 Tax=Corynebacterium deserti GIMN1.010 TaxID=931089 RepID=A0A0M5IG55_9CORY|nr:M18 family aminopeptidase [Corynebacterium deserti]ALC05861.1 putative M18 family aminopeptidase 2 [Corynebacterium deserti GIMN1.010]